MVESMEIPKVFKKTEVGIIPKDWDVVSLGRIASITKLAGFEYSKHFNSYRDGGDIIVLRGTNITNNVLDLSDVKTIPAKTSKNLLRSKLFKGDLVFAYVGTIGPVYLVEENDKFHLGPNTSKITLDETVDTKYIFNYFKSWLIRNEIFEHTSIGAQPSLSMTKIRKFRIVIPSLKVEQTAIAEALNDADALITELEKLIAKKKAIKQGAMQELLKPKKGWEVKKLGEVAYIKTGSRNNEDKIENGEYPFFVRSPKVERINTYSYDCEAILIPGDGNIGEIFHYIIGKFEVHQRVYKISDFSNKVLGKFIYRWFQKYFKEHAYRYTAKNTVDSLRLPIFQDFEISFPNPDEQTRINHILSDMDAEIETLEQKLDKHKMLKQGMMQTLLTGRIRLI
jgi:type I restriction enzyme, S subunit